MVSSRWGRGSSPSRRSTRCSGVSSSAGCACTCATPAGDFAKYGKHLNGREIDFDDVRPGATDATLLEIQVRYLYEMRIPFANKLIQTMWMATHVKLGGSAPSRVGGIRHDVAAALTANGGDAVELTAWPPRACPTTTARREGEPRRARRRRRDDWPYYLPLEAYYTMRMQSNPFKKWAHP